MTAVPLEQLLVNLGTPSSATEEGVRDFLGEFLADPMVVELPRWLWLPVLRGIVLRKRPARVARMYSTIWTAAGSPLASGTERIARAVGAHLDEAGAARAAYRYGRPSLENEIDAALARAEQVVVTPLYAQRTASSSGTIERLVARLGRGPRVRVAMLAPDDPGYVTALAGRLAEALAAAPAEPEHLLLSFHGIPAAVDRREGGVYAADCARTTAALLSACGWPEARATLAFQSRFGPARWLGPPTEETLVALAKQGLRRVAVATPGFLTEGLETLEEIGERAEAAFLEAGGQSFVRVPCVEDHPALVEALAGLAAGARAFPRP